MQPNSYNDIMHNIRYYEELLLLRNSKRITQNMFIYAKPPILRNNLLRRLMQGTLPFQCLAAGAAALARDPVLSWLWDFELFSKSIVHHRYESFFALLCTTWPHPVSSGRHQQWKERTVERGRCVTPYLQDRRPLTRMDLRAVSRCDPLPAAGAVRAGMGLTSLGVEGRIRPPFRGSRRIEGLA